VPVVAPPATKFMHCTAISITVDRMLFALLLATQMNSLLVLPEQLIARIVEAIIYHPSQVTAKSPSPYPDNSFEKIVNLAP
jgi:hypothetical protein